MTYRQVVVNSCLTMLLACLVCSLFILITVLSKVQVKNVIEYNEYKISEARLKAAEYSLKRQELLYNVEEARLKSFMEKYK